MPDTGIWTPWKEETVSEHELREWMKDISKDLKESLAAQAKHERESAVFQTATNGRVKALEEAAECASLDRRGFWSGTKGAGIAALFGAAAALIGKKTGMW